MIPVGKGPVDRWLMIAVCLGSRKDLSLCFGPSAAPATQWASSSADSGAEPVDRSVGGCTEGFADPVVIAKMQCLLQRGLDAEVPAEVLVKSDLIIWVNKLLVLQ